MSDVTTLNYTIADIKSAFYGVTGEAIGLTADVLTQLRTDLPDLIVLIVLVGIMGKLFNPVTKFLGSIMGTLGVGMKD